MHGQKNIKHVIIFDILWSMCLLLLDINPLKTKCRLLYLKTQSLPRCKHFSSLKVAQVALCFEINTKHINKVWAERTVVES